MDVKEILRHVDHTLLAPTATWEEIRQICDDGIKYSCASVCIPQTYVAHAAHYIAEQQHYGFGQLPVCTVIGFPNGYVPSGIKCMETESAVADGATEIDMVINLGWVKEGQYDKILQEINSVKISCHGNILKVIIETCMLTDEERSSSARSFPTPRRTTSRLPLAPSAGGGATREDVALMAAHMTNGKKIKAAGGIANLQDAEDFLKLGADRLGTSRIVKAVKGHGERRIICQPPTTTPKTAISRKPCLMPGDPLRAKFIAETFFENPAARQQRPRRAGLHRHLQGRARERDGQRHGHAVHRHLPNELYTQYGVENIIRVGSAGAMRGHGLGSVCAGMGACTNRASPASMSSAAPSPPSATTSCSPPRWRAQRSWA